jgi:hypothetical protein
MCQGSICEVLSDVFEFLQRFRIEEDRHQSSGLKKIVEIIGYFLAFCVGITFGILSYTSTLAILASFSFLSIASAFFLPIAIALAIVTFACLFALMFNSIRKIIQTENIIIKCKEILYDLIDTDANLPRNQYKSYPRIVAERTVTILLTSIILILAYIGLFMTMINCAQQLSLTLLKVVPYAIANVVHIVSKIISLGLALAGQVPFVLRTSIVSVGNIFNGKSDTSDTPDRSAFTYLKSVSLMMLRVISAVGNGLVSMMGADGKITMVLAGIGATGNSFVAAAAAEDPALPPTTVNNKNQFEKGGDFIEKHKSDLMKIRSQDKRPLLAAKGSETDLASKQGTLQKHDLSPVKHGLNN